MLSKGFRIVAIIASAIGLASLFGCSGGYYGMTTPLTLAAPSNLTATAGNAQVTLNWLAPGATTAVAAASSTEAPLSYNLYYSTTTGVTPATGTKIGGINPTTYTQTGLTNGTTYYYVVTALYSEGESGPSNQASATPEAPVTIPPAPINLAATAGNAQVVLNWSASTGATSYNLYYSTTTGVTPANGTKISGNSATTYTQTGLTNGTTYYYVVTAVDSAGESPASNQASATPEAPVTIPPAPINLAATAGNAQVVLNWSASTGATSYNLYYSTTTGVTPANGTKISGISATTYTQTGLTNGTTYYYVVTAVDSAGESPASNQASATPEAPTLAAPLNLTATPGVGDATLSWTASTGATSYTVYYSTSSGVTPANGTKVAGITGTSYVVPSLTACTPYYFIVTAVDSLNASAASNQANATPLSATNAALTPGTAASLTLQADTNTSLTFSFPANAVTQPATVNLVALAQSDLSVPFTSTIGTFLGGYGMCFSSSSVTTLSAPVTISGTVGSGAPSGSALNLAEIQNSAYQPVSTFVVGTNGALTENLPSVSLPGALSAGSYALYVPATGTNTSVTNLGILLIADDGLTMADGNNGLQIIHIYDAKGNLLKTPTISYLDFIGSGDLDGEALTPDASQGIMVDGGNNVLFFSGLLDNDPKASSTVLSIENYGGDGDSVAILPNGDESVATGDQIPELVYISGILSGSPVIASTISVPSATSGVSGLVISNDGKVLLARSDFGQFNVLSIESIPSTPGTIAGTVTHSFTVEPVSGTPLVPEFEDGRDGMAISPADSTHGVLIGDNGTTFAAQIQMLTGLPKATVAGTPVALPTTCTEVYSVAISPDGKLAAVGCLGGVALFSGVDTGNLVEVGTLYAPTYTVNCSQTYTGCASSPETITLGANIGVTTIGFTLDGKYIVAGDGFNYAFVVIPVSSTGFGPVASALGNVAIPFNDQMVIH